MIDCLLNDIQWGRGQERASGLTVVFLGTWVGYCDAYASNTHT